MEIKKTFLILLMVFPLVGLSFITTNQNPSNSLEENTIYFFEIDKLSVDESAILIKRLNESDLELAYMCIPAQILAIKTTFNRLDYLKEFLSETFEASRILFKDDLNLERAYQNCSNYRTLQN